MNFSNSGTTSVIDMWSIPVRVRVDEYLNKIEMIYKQRSMMTYTIYPSPPPQERCFKIVFSCVDGKWNRSEPIFGTIVPARDEEYEFEN